MDSTDRFENLRSRMKTEWDERIRHDYRYWMSDGVSDDQEMWLTGERDFDLLTQGLSPVFVQEARVLDLACGVGRISRAAASLCHEVIGIDVSEEAVKTARHFLKDYSNVRILQGDGVTLKPILDQQFELVISFASLGSMPARVLSGYLSEIARVVLTNGKIRLQIYLGREQDIAEEDTLALRSYNEERFLNALTCAGFSVEYMQEVLLPFEVSDYQNGVVAYIIGGERTPQVYASPEEILKVLMENPETASGERWKGSRTAYLVAVARAAQHAKAERFKEAKEAIGLALEQYRGDVTEAKKILNEISKSSFSEKQSSSIASEISGLNGQVQSRLQAGSKTNLLAIVGDKERVITAINTVDGIALEYKGISLSHRQYPLKAAENWAKRAYASIRDKEAAVLLVGIGDLHFARALRRLINRPFFVYESNKEILAALPELSLKEFDIINDFESLDSMMKIRLQGRTPELVILPSSPFYASDVVSEIRRRVSTTHLIKTLRPEIAVVGPLHGGSLPIAEYVQRAFFSMGHRSSYINLAPYFSTFNSFSNFLKKTTSRGQLENQYVELLSDLVFQIAEERKIDILVSVAQAPLSPRVLEKCQEKGIVTVHWFMEDTRRFPTWKDIAKYYDYFFIIQKGESINELRNAGGRRVSYLPLACDPQIHCPQVLSTAEKEEFGSAVSFVGAGYNNRRHVFSKMIRPDFKIWGTEWPDVVPFSTLVQRRGARISVSDYVKIFSGSTVNINLHSSQERDGVDPSGDFINPRTFELAACKAFQLVDHRSLLAENFREDEIATFTNERELKEKIDYYLKRPEVREEFVNKAYQRVIKEHTYEHRLNTMLEHVYADFGDRLVDRTNNDDWQHALKAAESDPDLQEYLLNAKNRGASPVLEDIVAPLLNSRGCLKEVEQKLLFLHHMRGQITEINRLRNPHVS